MSKTELELTTATQFKAPIRIIVSIFASMVVVVATVVSTWLNQKHAIETRMAAMDERITQLAHDNVSVNQFNHWAYDLKDRNAALIVPRLPEKGEAATAQPVQPFAQR